MKAYILLALAAATQATRLHRLIMVDKDGNPLDKPDDGLEVPEVNYNPNHPPKEVVGTPFTQDEI